MPSKPYRGTDARPFYWTQGTVQLFISHRSESVWVGSTLAEYDRNRPVGTDWGRRYTQRAVDVLNDRWEAGDRRTDQAAIQDAIRQAQNETPFEAVRPAA